MKTYFIILFALIQSCAEPVQNETKLAEGSTAQTKPATLDIAKVNAILKAIIDAIIVEDDLVTKAEAVIRQEETDISKNKMMADLRATVSRTSWDDKPSSILTTISTSATQQGDNRLLEFRGGIALNTDIVKMVRYAAALPVTFLLADCKHLDPKQAHYQLAKEMCDETAKLITIANFSEFIAVAGSVSEKALRYGERTEADKNLLDWLRAARKGFATPGADPQGNPEVTISYQPNDGDGQVFGSRLRSVTTVIASDSVVLFFSFESLQKNKAADDIGKELETWLLDLQENRNHGQEEFKFLLETYLSFAKDIVAGEK